MQVLNLFRYELPIAIKTDWHQFWCGWRTNHDIEWTGTSYGRIDGKGGLISLGPPIVRHGYCRNCHKAVKVKL
jgi:hypothetical protein